MRLPPLAPFITRRCAAHRAALLAVACGLALAGAATAQDMGGRSSPAMVPLAQYEALVRRAADAEGRANALAAQLKAREDELAKASSRADKAERSLKEAAARPSGASAEQLGAALKERDAARARLAVLDADLRSFSADLDKAQRSLQAELAEARKQTQQARAQAEDLRRRLAAQAGADRAPPLPAPPAPEARNALQDRAELSVPGCGRACPSFIVIPHLGRVTLGRGDEAITADIRHRFAMGKTEVTVRQWRAFWDAPDRNYQPARTGEAYCQWQDWARNGEDHPVACVNTQDAEAFARWFEGRYARQLGVTVHAIGLPSEVEWEQAARGGRLTQDYLWDRDAESCQYAQTFRCDGKTRPVASLRANGYGLYDVTGNIWEWTASPRREDRSQIPAGGVDESGALVARVVRGGSFFNDDDRLRLSYRDDDLPGGRVVYIGFRLVARIAP